MNCPEYVRALEMLVSNKNTMFSYIEKDIHCGKKYYTYNIETSNIYAGDILDHFKIFARNIRRVGVKVDGILVWLQEVNNTDSFVFKPFVDGIYTISCDLSTIKLFIVCDTVPIVTSMYYLVNLETRKKLHRRTISFRDGTATSNGYFGLLVNNQKYVNHIL